MHKLIFAFILSATLILPLGQASAAVALPSGPGGGGNRNASILMVTSVINDDGGTALPSNFFTTYGDGVSVMWTWAAFPAPGLLIVVPPGNYAVEGSTHPAYRVSYDAGCSGTLASNGFATCNITYDDIGPDDVVPPANCPVGPTGCAPVEPPEAGGCPPSSPDCGTEPSTETSNPPGSVNVPNGSTTTSEELPRTGGGAFPIAFASLAAALVGLSLRKRS